MAPNMTRNILILIGFITALFGCSGTAPDDPAATVNAIANDFLEAYYTQHAEEVYEVGYPDAPNDRFGDHSASARAKWDAMVDGWIEALDAVDPDGLKGTPAAITYVFTRERLQALADMRICKMPLWNVSPTWTGWPYMIVSTLAVQAVDTVEQRDEALARAADIERFVRTDIDNLRVGQDKGYLAPASNVAAVVEQISTLIDTPVDDSPFMSPANRSGDEAFRKAYRDIYDSRILPSLIAYRDFLATDYEGREAIGVAANPDGKECYAASARYWSSIDMDPMDIHRRGLSEMSRIQSEMLAIARESFGTDDLSALFEELRTKPEYTFESEQHMLDYVNAAVERGRLAVPAWFGTVPDHELLVKPSPAYEKDSGGGFYSSGTADGSRPGIYQVGTYNPQGISRAGQEATVFHESWPGHHMQGSVAFLNDELHPIMSYMFISGSGEGWALYTERLAGEMGLYSDEVARLGMLSNEAYRAARLVVDPGIHVLGWTRQQAMDYMLENTAEGYDSVSSEVDRYAAVPGQATSYLLGSLEIQRLRANAEKILGDRFDIREFHDRILVNGSVALPMLGAEIDAWISEKTATD
jgi:uncharacterized protein (DUF885 family)